MSGSPGAIGPRQGADILTALRQGRIQGDEERLRATTQLLEGTFYQELFKAMRETVPEGGAIDSGSGSDMFQGLFDQRIADAAAGQSEGGLGDALYRYFASSISSIPPADTGSEG